jgi:hypothetical protein
LTGGQSLAQMFLQNGKTQLRGWKIKNKIYIGLIEQNRLIDFLDYPANINASYRPLTPKLF